MAWMVSLSRHPTISSWANIVRREVSLHENMLQQHLTYQIWRARALFFNFFLSYQRCHAKVAYSCKIAVSRELKTFPASSASAAPCAVHSAIWTRPGIEAWSETCRTLFFLILVPDRKVSQVCTHQAIGVSLLGRTENQDKVGDIDQCPR